MIPLPPGQMMALPVRGTTVQSLMAQFGPDWIRCVCADCGGVAVAQRAYGQKFDSITGTCLECRQGFLSSATTEKRRMAGDNTMPYFAVFR